MEKAIEKIEAEKLATKNPTIQRIADFLLEQLETHPEYAEKIVVDGKTIASSLKMMARYAMQFRDDNAATISDDEGFGIVLQYYGCWDGEPFEIPAEPERPVYTPPARAATTTPNAAPAPKGKAKKTSESPEQLSLFDDEFTPDLDDEDEGGVCCE
jgi:hypothetical protein